MVMKHLNTSAHYLQESLLVLWPLYTCCAFSQLQRGHMLLDCNEKDCWEILQQSRLTDASTQSGLVLLATNTFFMCLDLLCCGCGS